MGRLLISAVPAHHRARFFPGLKPVSDCIGFIIRGSHSIYFPGDTDLQLQLARLKSAHLDLCLLPIWGWAIDDHGQHLNPLKAAQALKLIQPKVAIPYHWGTFLPLVFKPFFSKYLIRPVDLFATATKKLAPGVQIIIVPPGKKIDITGKFS
ncbi:hypothetical protein A2W24_05125 [Microgenomates group bacterium RBG_16_45_19]|nr:MAG: hypothetical protein A2W24_05125 [Microgenomates group bacterium RBG_16_45_19]